VARSLIYLGNLHRDLGDLTTAHALFERALAIREARLGLDHPDTKQARLHLAALEHALKDQP